MLISLKIEANMKLTNKIMIFVFSACTVFGMSALGSTNNGQISGGKIAVVSCRAQGFEKCPNCEADVIVHARTAQKFADQFLAMSSMPLCGEVIGILSSGKARVRVTLAKDYAIKNQLNSFDVAKKISSFTSNGNLYKVDAITAKWNFNK
jgi:hypothetical protein